MQRREEFLEIRPNIWHFQFFFQLNFSQNYSYNKLFDNV